MTNLFEQIDNVALTMSRNTTSLVWFPSRVFKYALRQIPLTCKASNQCKFDMARGDVTGLCFFKTAFYELGDIPIQLYQIKDMLVQKT